MHKPLSSEPMLGISGRPIAPGAGRSYNLVVVAPPDPDAVVAVLMRLLDDLDRDAQIGGAK